MDRWTGRKWVREFVLLKEWHNGPADYLLATDRVLIPDIGLGGGRSNAIRIPTEARSGLYRIRDDVSFQGEPYIDGIVTLSARLEIVD